MFKALKTFARSMFSPSFRAGRREGLKVRREFEAAARVVRARYDAAQTNDHNSAHWGMTDSLSARAALNPGVRKRLRERSRYEIENNSWLSGIVDTLAHHTIGIGPRIQILHENEAACLRVQRAFKKWCESVQFAEKLLTAKTCWGQTGEVYALKIRNKNLWPIQLDFRLYEPEQVSNPYANYDPSLDDGIHLDPNGIPDSYFFLKHHPGDPQFNSVTHQGDWFEAKDVLHYFHRKRPGQNHGVPPFTPSLELAPILRRLTRASLKAAEVAASHSSVIKTTAAGIEVAGSPQDFAAIEFEAGMNTVLPEGWDITQLRSEHPSSTFDMIVRVILNEIARPVSMPYNIAACNSAGYNYSSGRLDHQTYYKSIEVDQSLFESQWLNSLFRSWLEEAVFVRCEFDDWVLSLGINPVGLNRDLLAVLKEAYREESPGLLDGLPPIHALDWQWCWDAQPVIDEGTDASASTQRIQSGQSTLPLEWQRRGYGDVEAQLKKGAKALGLTIQQYQQLLQFKTFGMTAGQLPTVVPVSSPAGVAQSAGANPGSTSSTPSAGAFVGTNRRDFTNNIKATKDVMRAFIGGESEVMTKAALSRLGWSDADAQSLIDDARDGTIDSGTLDEIGAPT